jgi:hypothetical protein
MVGSWGLEPQTSTVSIQQAKWEGMRRSKRKLHEHKPLPPILAPLSGIEFSRFASSCNG